MDELDKLEQANFIAQTLFDAWKSGLCPYAVRDYLENWYDSDTGTCGWSLGYSESDFQSIAKRQKGKTPSYARTMRALHRC